MLAIFTGEDEIDGRGRIELVDFVCILKDGHVPFEEVNEDPLACFEHDTKRRVGETGANCAH